MFSAATRLNNLVAAESVPLARILTDSTIRLNELFNHCEVSVSIVNETEYDR